MNCTPDLEAGEGEPRDLVVPPADDEGAVGAGRVPVLQGEEEAAKKAGLSDSMNKAERDKAIDMFKIEDEEEEEQNAEN